MTSSSVVVVGAGPVGLTHALGLARRGVSVTVVEQHSAAGTTPGDLVYHWNVLPGLERLGVLEDLIAVGDAEPLSFYRVRSTGETLPFDLGVMADETPYPFNLHVRQDEVTRVLLEHLSRRSGVTMLLSSPVVDVERDDSGVTARIEGPEGLVELRADWLVGADGARSVVRRQLGLAFAGMTWPERMVTVEVDADLAPFGLFGAGYVIDPRLGAIVACVEPGRRWRYIHAENRTVPEAGLEDRLRVVLAEAFAPAVGESPMTWSTYRIHQRCAATFRVGRVMLLGDAAHITNPVSGHGMTSGLFDSFSLTEALTAVIDGKAAESLLDRWAVERRRNYLEHSSPVSSERKKLVYNLESDAEVEDEIAPYRRMSQDRDLMRGWFAMARRLEPPTYA